MRRRHTLPVAALLATALLGLAGCGGSAKPSQPALAKTAGARSAAAGQTAHQHDPGQAPSGPAVAPRNGVLDMRVDELGPQDVVFTWKPGNVLLKPGQKVTLKVANNDYMQHNLLFKAAGVNQNLPVHKITTIKFTAPQAGTYVFWCKYHLQMMQGKATVQP
jgi:plastocyanin